MTLTFATFLAGYNIQYTLLDATSPVIGISFLMILLRLNFNKYGPNSTSRETVSQRGTAHSYPLRSINIGVAQHVEGESDFDSKPPGKRSYGDMA